MVQGIILAAGFSSRFVGYKMEKLLNGKTILDHTILSMKDYVDKIYIVTGYKREIVEEICSKYDFIETIYNKDFEDGMFSSVKKGISKIKSKKFFLIPGDYPLIKNNTYEELLKSEGDIVVPSYNQKGGHPILIDYKVVENIENTKAENLREYFSDYNKTYINIEDEGVLLDIDTYDDYLEIKRRVENENN